MDLHNILNDINVLGLSIQSLQGIVDDRKALKKSLEYCMKVASKIEKTRNFDTEKDVRVDYLLSVKMVILSDINVTFKDLNPYDESKKKIITMILDDIRTKVEIIDKKINDNE